MAQDRPLQPVDPNSLNKADLLMLVSASRCPFCDHRPRLEIERSNGAPQRYFFGCYHLSVSPNYVHEAFASWEEALRDFIKEHKRKVTRLRKRLNSRVLVDAKLTAVDWDLFDEPSQASKSAAEGLNRALNEAVSSSQCVKEVQKTMWATMGRFREVGASDTEPSAVLETLLDFIAPDRMRTTGPGWVQQSTRGVVGLKSLSRSELLMLESASRCPFCDHRPQFEHFKDASGWCRLGCYHRSVPATDIRSAFALWEPTLRRFVREHKPEVTRLRTRLNSRTLINATLTAADWELLRASTQASKNAAEGLNKALIEAVSSSQSVKEVQDTMWATMDRFREVGAGDTEPRAVLKTLLDLIFPERLRRTGTRADEYDHA
jgi:hypothetical protein